MPVLLVIVFIVMMYNDMAGPLAALLTRLPALLMRTALAVGVGWLYYRILAGGLHRLLGGRQDRLVAKIWAMEAAMDTRRTRVGVHKRPQMAEDVEGLKRRADAAPAACLRGYAALKAGAWLAALAAFLDPAAVAVAAGLYTAFRLVTRHGYHR